MMLTGIPTRSSGGDNYFSFWRDWGFSDAEANGFKHDMRMIYCWKLLNNTGQPIGILSLDTKFNRPFTPDLLNSIGELFVGVLSSLIQEERFKYNLSKST